MFLYCCIVLEVLQSIEEVDQKIKAQEKSLRTKVLLLVVSISVFSSESKSNWVKVKMVVQSAYCMHKDPYPFRSIRTKPTFLFQCGNAERTRFDGCWRVRSGQTG